MPLLVKSRALKLDGYITKVTRDGDVYIRFIEKEWIDNPGGCYMFGFTAKISQNRTKLTSDECSINLTKINR